MYWCVFADNAPLFWVSKHISLWGSISFNLAVLINLAVALFYPFGDDGDEGTVLFLTYKKLHNYGPIVSMMWKMCTESWNPVIMKFTV